MIEFSRHAYPGYDASVESLLGELNTMAEAVEHLLEMLGDALRNGNAKFKEAKELDKAVNHLEDVVIGKLHSLLSKYNPSLDELRFLLSTVRIAAALERIGDIAKASVKRHERALQDGCVIDADFAAKVVLMLDMTRNMLRASMEQLNTFDTETLNTLLEQDEEVDELYVELLHQLQHDGSHSQAEAKRDQTLSILIKDVERAADHTFEMGRIAYFAHTGNKPRKKHIREGVLEG